MRYAARSVIAVMAVTALMAGPAAALPSDGGGTCEGLATALTKVTNSRAREAIQANAARECPEEQLTPASACAAVDGWFIDAPLAFGSGIPGVVEWRCDAWPTAELTGPQLVAFLEAVCDGTLLVHQPLGGKYISDCWY